MKLVGDNVAVKLDAPKEATEGGIVLPQNKEPSRTGVITVVGPGEFSDGTRIPLTVQVGDRVLLDSYGGTEVRIKGETIKIVDESSILAILEEGDE